jgi:hypothetical protein
MSDLRKAAWLFVAWLLLAMPALGQSQRTDPDVVRRIQSGEVAAFNEAARTGNHAYVPELLRALRGLGYSAPLAEALATLDDPSGQRYMWCESIGSNYPLYAISSYSAVGGWFSIRALQAILGGAVDSTFSQSKQAKEGGDDIKPKPSAFALDVLPLLLPEAGIGRFSDQQRGDTRALQRRLTEDWLAWIDAHRTDLQRRAPLGAAVDLTLESCRAKPQ